jgi:hypothetical protein
MREDYTYGTVKYKRKLYILDQNAYYDNGEYVASAHDKDGEVYKVHWRALKDFGYRAADDEGNACNWDRPFDVTKCGISVSTGLYYYDYN